LNNLTIIGVPEHFNMPWHVLLESHYATRAGLDLGWEDCPEGSGAMARALDSGRADIGILLTEAAVAAAAGRSFEIVSQFTDSPLIWGIHVPPGKGIRVEDDIRGARYAISRFGSGSHLMSFAHAQARGWPLSDLLFVEVGTLQGALEAFVEGRADVFFWEKFMTKPIVERGDFERVGEFTAPWPAFVVCAAKSALQAYETEIRDLLASVCLAAQGFQNRSDAARLIARRYGLKQRDAEEWLRLTRWSQRVGIDGLMLERVAAMLRQLGLLKESR
jgi:sulfonate transport system substrate-binding protein